MKTVSVVIPTYNRINFLFRAIDSILKQGQDNAIAVAEPVLQKTKEIIGFLT